MENLDHPYWCDINDIPIRTSTEFQNRLILVGWWGAPTYEKFMSVRATGTAQFWALLLIGMYPMIILYMIYTVNQIYPCIRHLKFSNVTCTCTYMWGSTPYMRRQSLQISAGLQRSINLRCSSSNISTTSVWVKTS